MNEIFHLLMYKCIHNYIMHKCLKHPEHSPTRLLGSLLTITYSHLSNHLEKTLMSTLGVLGGSMVGVGVVST